MDCGNACHVDRWNCSCGAENRKVKMYVDYDPDVFYYQCSVCFCTSRYEKMRYFDEYGSEI